MSKFLFLKKWIIENKFFFVGFLLSLSLLWPLFKAPYFSHHDDVQVIRLYEMSKCFKDGQIPCRLVPDLGGLYGYPIFNYYAPLPYYFGEIIYFISNSLIFSAKIMFAASFLGAYVFMYLLGRKIWGEMGGSIAGIFYSFAPYHSVDFYVRGAMGEMWALMLFPLNLWAFLRLIEKINIVNLLISSFSVALLFTSHNLSAMIFSPVIMVWIIMLFLKKKEKKFIWFSVFSFLLGLALSAFYLLPMLVEKNLVHVETTTYGYFSYTEHFKGLRKLLLDTSWGWGASVREVPGGEKDGLSFQIGWVHLLSWVVVLILAFKSPIKDKFIRMVVLFSSVGVLVSIFMIHPRSEFVWKAIESLKFIQFPWRFLMLTIFFISFLSGGIFFFLQNQKIKKIMWIVLVTLVVILNFSHFRPEKFIQTSDKELLTGENWDKQIKRSIFDYLPIYAKAPPAELATKRYEILSGDIKVINYKEGTNWISFNTYSKTNSTIRLSQYYFPDWKILIDEKETSIEYNNSLGLMTINIPKGDHKIEARFYDTPIRSISNIISLITVLLMAFLFLYNLKKDKKNTEN